MPKTPRDRGAAIERRLAQAGVPEGANPPYRTTARMIVAHLADAALRGGEPDAETMDQLVRVAREIVHRFWDNLQSENWRGDRLEFIADHDVHWSHGQVFACINGIQGNDTRYMIPSIAQEHPTAPRKAHPSLMPSANAAGDAIVAAALHLLERTLDPGTPIRARSREITRAWQSREVQVHEDGLWWTAASWTGFELAHLSHGDLMKRVATAPKALVAGRRDLHRLKSVTNDLKRMLDKVASDSGLPIGFDVRTHPGGHPEPTAWLVVEGYGPSGRRRVETVRTITQSVCEPKRLAEEVADTIRSQRKRHKAYGPVPGAAVVDWTIDTVSARRLAQQRDAEDLLEQCLEEGSVRVDEGFKLRVSGSRILGDVEIAPGVVWRGETLQAMGITLPDTMLNGVRGRALTDVVASPELLDAGVVRHAAMDQCNRKPRLTLRVTPTMQPIGHAMGNAARAA